MREIPDSGRAVIAFVIMFIIYFFFFDLIEAFVNDFSHTSDARRAVISVLFLFSYGIAALLQDIYKFRWVLVKRFFFFFKCFIDFIHKNYVIIFVIFFILFLFIFVYCYA